jgi:hypothetical protein
MRERVSVGKHALEDDGLPGNPRHEYTNACRAGMSMASVYVEICGRAIMSFLCMQISRSGSLPAAANVLQITNYHSID